MGRLVDADDVYNAIQITTDNFGVLKGVVESNMLEMLSKIETVEVISKGQYKARLKEGHWEHIKDEFGRHLIRCSCCKYTEPEYIIFSRKYCPDCGAKMKDEESEVEDWNDNITSSTKAK